MLKLRLESGLFNSAMQRVSLLWVGLTAALWCGGTLADSLEPTEWTLVKDIAAQLPVVVLLFIVVVYGDRQRARERTEWREEARVRDAQFIEALQQNNENIAANTVALRDLDKAISIIASRNGLGGMSR